MFKINPVIAYMMILSVIQPASIEEIEEHAAKFFGTDWATNMIKYNAIRDAHSTALNLDFISEVKKGKFSATPKGSEFVRFANVKDSIDKKRVYYLKQQMLASS